MKRHILAALAVAALSATAVLSAATSASANEEADVLAANAGFYSALNTMFTGDAGPMMDVWSHKDDVTYMGPTGKYERGWAAIEADWQAQAKLKLGGKVEPSDMNVVIGETLAVVSEYEVGTNTNADGKTASVKLRGTNVFRKEGDAWKMIAHHTDTLPYLDKP
jgi:ketosteroid isomerase-like protein